MIFVLKIYISSSIVRLSDKPDQMIMTTLNGIESSAFLNVMMPASSNNAPIKLTHQSFQPFDLARQIFHNASQEADKSMSKSVFIWQKYFGLMEAIVGWETKRCNSSLFVIFAMMTSGAMQIIIKSETFYSSKKIFIDGEELYVAKSEALLSAEHLKIIHLPTGYTRAILSLELYIFGGCYNIRLLNEDNVLLKFPRSDFGHVYKGTYSGDDYKISTPDHISYSIVKNDEVIGSWKGETNFGDNDEFEITSFDEKTIGLILCFCLIIHNRQCQRRHPD